MIQTCVSVSRGELDTDASAADMRASLQCLADAVVWLHEAIQSLLQILALQLLGQATLSNKQARAHNSQPAGLVS